MDDCFPLTFTRQQRGIFDWAESCEWTRDAVQIVLVSDDLAKDTGWRRSRDLCLGPYRLRVNAFYGYSPTLLCTRISGPTEERVRNFFWVTQSLIQSAVRNSLKALKDWYVDFRVEHHHLFWPW